MSSAALREDAFVAIPAAAARSHAGFRAWVTSDEFPEQGVQASYINGEILIDMSPEEIETHNKVKTIVTETINRLVRRQDLGEFYSDRVLVTNVAAGVSNEPDALFVSWASFEAGRVRFAPRKGHPEESLELVGTPDWVLEVVSRGTIRKDTALLRDAYHRAGIPEYWLITAFSDDVDFQVLRRRRDRYVVTAPRDGWSRSTVFGRPFRLTRRKNRMGRWSYALDMRPE